MFGTLTFELLAMKGWSLCLLLGVAVLRRRSQRPGFVALPFQRFVACRSSKVPAESDFENDELMAMLMRPGAAWTLLQI